MIIYSESIKVFEEVVVVGLFSSLLNGCNSKVADEDR